MDEISKPKIPIGLINHPCFLEARRTKQSNSYHTPAYFKEWSMQAAAVAFPLNPPGSLVQKWFTDE
jgi:hypothetical protein